MGLDKNVALKAMWVMAVVIVAVSGSVEGAGRLDLNPRSTMTPDAGVMDDGACCDSCACTSADIFPVRCLCRYVTDSCSPTGCANCVAMLKWPPVYACWDVIPTCRKPCTTTSSSTPAQILHL